MASPKAKRRSPTRLIITTGDTDGVGQEVTYKALLKNRLPGMFFVFTSDETHRSIRRLREQVLKNYDGEVYDSLDAAISNSSSRMHLIESSEPPPRWVEQAALACLQKRADALVTAPLSKTLIRDSGMTDIGHTEILARICGVPKSKVRMGFVGRHFDVVLASGHIPLKNVSGETTPESLLESLRLADLLRKLSGKNSKKLPLALVGLNPHASDDGLIGHEEHTIFQEALRLAQQNGLIVKGPLVPDAAFLPENWRRYSVYVCPYHDQGLIPFKAIHGQKSGTHVTLGLPIIRTSVDHGTAKDLFGKNKADPGSMIEALHLAIKMGESNVLSTRYIS